MTRGHIYETVSEPCWLDSKTHVGQVQEQETRNSGYQQTNKNIVAYMSSIQFNSLSQNSCNCFIANVTGLYSTATSNAVQKQGICTILLSPRLILPFALKPP